MTRLKIEIESRLNLTFCCCHVLLSSLPGGIFERSKLELKSEILCVFAFGLFFVFCFLNEKHFFCLCNLKKNSYIHVCCCIELLLAT